MIEEVYRPSRKKNGKRVVSRVYRGKFRIHPRDKIKYVALYSTDKQVAQQRLHQIVLDEQRERRSFTEDELQRLIRVAGLRGVVYRIAARTGIRRGELTEVQWRDVHLDTTQPFIFVRASISKNHRQAMQPLTPDAVEALCTLRSDDAKPYDRVFASLMPRGLEQFKKDLKAADIP